MKLSTNKVICVHSNVSNHYFWKQGGQNNTCNWTVQVVCENSFVIDILNVTVSYYSCGNDCSSCTGSDVSGTSTVDNITTIQQYINEKCHNLRSCNTALPYPGDMKNKNATHVTVYYNCTENKTGTDTDIDTSTSKVINGTTADMLTYTPTLTDGATENTTGSYTNTNTSTLTVTNVTTVGVYSSPPAFTDGDTENTTGSDTNTDTSTLIVTNVTTVGVYSSPPALTDGDTENTTGSDTNTDTSTLIVTKVTTVSVYSSPATHIDGSSSKDPGTEKQSSSMDVVFTVVSTVLLLVAITLVTVVIIARQKQRRTNADEKTAIQQFEFDTDVLHDRVSSEATRSLNVNGVRHSRMTEDNVDYNTINLITFTVTSDPTYNHVNYAFVDPQYGRPNVHPLNDSDYAFCADIDEAAIVDHPYSHIINNTHTSNEINSNQGLTARVSRSDYDHIELENCNGNHIDDSTTGDNTNSLTGTQSLNGRFLVDVDKYGDDYSHIEHVGHATDADCFKNWQRGVAEAWSSSYIVNTCETGTASKVDFENNESRDIHDSREDTSVNVNVNELNGGKMHPLYQVKECDDSCESSHSYFILEKLQ